MQPELKNYGYVPSKIDDTHYQFGAASLPRDILQYDKNWEPYLPSFESQDITFETDGCVPFGTTNILETLLKKIFGGDYNYAERYLYNLLRIVPPVGSDPHTCAEYIRTNGAIDDSLLPMTSTLSEYSMPRPVTPQYLAKGAEWLAQHSFGHEWVFTNSPSRVQRVALMNEALQYSPLGITVTAWYPPVNGMYPDNGAPNTHWVCCFKLDGDSPVIFDSYAQDGNPIKKLSPDHHIEMCKRYYIGLSTNQPSNMNWFSGWFRSLLETLGIIQKEINTMPKTPTTPVITPPDAPHSDLSPVQPTPAPLSPLLWDTPLNARHSVRVICDEEGLSVVDKNDLCATVGAESGWKPLKDGKPNYDGSVDRGICQINDRLWIGDGKLFSSVDYVHNNPEVCIRWMCKMWKAGHQDWWIAHKNGSYKNYYQLI